MEYRFKEGEKVVCISQDFPVIKKYGGTLKESDNTPKKGELLTIDEILGDFLRFDKYDTIESNNWWKNDRFSPINEAEFEMKKLISESLTIKT